MKKLLIELNSGNIKLAKSEKVLRDASVKFDFLNAKKDYPGTAADVARHAAHIIKVGGEDCLGLGSDFDGIRTHAELPGADAMPVLEDALAKAGLTARQRDKVMGENVLRVYREVLG